MNKEDMREEFKVAAKAAGKLVKTGYNALSDKAEHDRQMVNITNANMQAAAAKASAMVPLNIPLTPAQRAMVDPAGCYSNVPGQMMISLDLNQENIVTAHNIGRIKTIGGQDYASLLEDVLKEHSTNASTIYLRLRYELARLWIYKVAPNVDVKTPVDGVVINSSLVFRYGLQVATTTMDNVIIPNLNNLWNTDVALILFLKEWGLHSYTVSFVNNIISVELQ